MKPVMRWVLGMGLVAMAATGAVAQGQGSEAETFLAAIRDQDGAKVNEIKNRLGATVMNYRGYNGDTPLTVAMASRNIAYVNFLIANQARPDLADKRGDTALIIAARSGFAEGVDRMLTARASVDAANRQGETPLIVAVQGRHARIVRRLLEKGASPDKTDIAAGYSARDYARRDNRNPEILRLIDTVKPVKNAVSGPVIK